MDLTEHRKQIYKIDDEILKLFLDRMEIASKVADYKKENNLSTLQKGREREILKRVSEKAGEEMADYSRMLFTTLMDLSKSYQNKRNAKASGELSERISLTVGAILFIPSPVTQSVAIHTLLSVV